MCITRLMKWAKNKKANKECLNRLYFIQNLLRGNYKILLK